MMRAAWVALAAMASALGWGAPCVHADPIDTLTPAEVVWADHGGASGVCGIFDRYGISTSIASQVVVTVHDVSGFALSPDSSYIVNYAVWTYCPRYWPALVAIGNQARAGADQKGVLT